MGAANNNDLSFSSNEGLKQYAINLTHFQAVPQEKQSLKYTFPKTNPDLIQLMEEMLEINPFFRPTA